MIALDLLKFKRLKNISVLENEEELRRKVLEVRGFLEKLRGEVRYLYDNDLGATPLVEALLEEYGFSDLRRVEMEIVRVIESIDRIWEGSYSVDDISKVERLLECLARRASVRSQELMIISRKGW